MTAAIFADYSATVSTTTTTVTSISGDILGINIFALFVKTFKCLF